MSKTIEQNIEVGKFFKFGELGVAFEIIEMNGENAKIRVIESGEELDYPISKISTECVVH